VEDAVAAGDGRRHAAVVQQVGPEQAQPGRGAVHRRQVRVLGVACSVLATHSTGRSAKCSHEHEQGSSPGARRQAVSDRFRTRITDGAMDHVPAAGEEALDEPRGHEASRAGHAHRRPRPRPPCCDFHGTDHDDLRAVIKFTAGRLGDTPINLVQIVDVDNLALGDVLIPELPGYVYITLVGQRTRWDPMCIQYFVSYDAHGDRVWVYLVQLNCTSEVVF